MESTWTHEINLRTHLCFTPYVEINKTAWNISLDCVADPNRWDVKLYAEYSFTQRNKKVISASYTFTIALIQRVDILVWHQ